MTRILFLLLATCALCARCKERSSVLATDTNANYPVKTISPVVPAQDSGIKAIHVFVALCDNKYQGIVPVPAAIGNGQDPARNLYWGAGYGIKSYFKKSYDWKLVATRNNPAKNILERLLFKHVSKNIYLLADAYDGKFIREATVDFLNSSGGQAIVQEKHGDQTIYFGGKSDLVAYIGHDGLMDFSLDQAFERKATQSIDAIILACYSKNYFSKHLRFTGATPVLWTSGLMAPEAYTLHDAIHEWAANNSAQAVRTAAARAYSKYQKCSLKAAHNLLVQGW
jgi:hypothetical protein